MKQQILFRNLRIEDQHLLRLALLTLALVILVAISFGSYYYWDRYIHLGDKSPAVLAAEHLQQQVRDNPQDPELRISLASMYLKDGLPKQAIDQVNQVLERYPDHQEAFIIGQRLEISRESQILGE